MADLYEKKNSNYGDSFGQLFEELGPTAGLVPLWNKLHRATSLVKGSQNNFESLEDTFKDLACYAIMNLIEMEAQEEKEYKNVEKLLEYVTAPSISTVGNPDIDFEPITNAYDSTNPCEGCDPKKISTYIGGVLPCQWCKNSPCKITYGTTTVALTTKNTNGGICSSADNKTVKGSNSNE